MTFTIRRAELADAGPLAGFAARTFAETYAAANDPPDMAEHLSTKYGEAIQAGEIQDPAMTYLLAESERGLAGYALLRFEHGPEGTILERPVELVRFYIAREWHGRGLAQSLMAACIEEARQRGGRALWLAVWRENARAIAFYRKSGFDISGMTRFRLGSQVQDDHLMIRPLATGRPAEPAGTG
jgi:ribosomal protein S18 acetylase RimI-like enzyme